MTIGILNERLKCTIGSGFAGQPDGSAGIQMVFPFVKAVDNQSKVPSAMVRVDGLLAVANQMQFLNFSQSKPGSGEVKVRSIHGWQLHHIAIKGDASVDVFDVKGDVIELLGFHRFSAIPVGG